MVTKKELVDILAQYPNDAQVIFNDDELNRALELKEIHFRNDGYVPDLCPDKPCPKIFIHLRRKK